MRKTEVMGIRFPAGTAQEIKHISEVLYFDRSIADYINECVRTKIEEDRVAIQYKIDKRKRRTI